MSDRLEIGDIVQLNSGGPRSEIISCDGDMLTAQWRNEKKLSKLTLPRSCFTKTPLGSVSCTSTASCSPIPASGSQTSKVAKNAD